MELTKSKIAFIRSLSEKKYRDENGLFVAEGEKLCQEIINEGFIVRDIFVTENIGVNNGVMITKEQMKRISSLKTPSNMLIVVEKPNYGAVKIEKKRLYLALDTIQDPGNMGTILRLADWFGIEAIFCSEQCADIYNPKVVQATMGAIARVKVIYCNLTELLSNCQMPIYGTFLDGDNIYKSDIANEGVIVMGNEGRGVSKVVEATVSHRLFIPSFPAERPTVESLNVATATAVVLSEFRRLG